MNLLHFYLSQERREEAKTHKTVRQDIPNRKFVSSIKTIYPVVRCSKFWMYSLLTNYVWSVNNGQKLFPNGI